MKRNITVTTWCRNTLSIALIVLGCSDLANAQSLDQNYISSKTVRVSGIKDDAALRVVLTDKAKVQSTIQYADGLGRPIQTVQRMGSPLGRDVVQPVVYDQYGRETIKYLPYVPSVTTGAYIPAAITAQGTFYTTPPSGVAVNTYPYAETVLEASPLARPLEQGAPGAAWQLSTSNGTDKGHTLRMVYALNNNISFASDSVNSRQVALYNVTINADKSRALIRYSNATYNDNELTVTISKDENWVSGRAGTVEEYKDNEGHVVLKRQYNYKNNALEVLSTYYVYDDLGNLCYVLPPETNADTASAISSQVISDLCYEYWYDELNRMFRKKLPGKGWDFIVYNTRDQVVLTQDANQRNQTPQIWNFNKYDALGRVISTGLYAQTGTTADASIYTPNNANLVTLQNTFNTTTAPKWESRNNANASGYDNLSDPLPFSSLTLHTINYYDDYSAPSPPAAYTAPATASLATRGLPTYQYTNVLGTTGMLSSKLYYDDYGRPLKTYKQHYLGGTINAGNYDATSNTYDFNGAVTTAARQHFTSVNLITPKITVANTYIYDHAGRKLKSWIQITNGTTPTTKTLLSKTDYNEIGQAKTKYQHSTDSLTYLHTISYAYTERGWLSYSNSALFEEQLYYNLASPYKQYNGNVAYQRWGTSAAVNTSAFNYQYDKLNRLTSGVSLDNFKEQNIVYDKHGNITKLKRYLNNVFVDDLSYTYNGANQLQTITDATASDLGLKHGTWNYTYDNNGNLTTDPSKGLTTSYNVLNLPQSNTITGASPGTVTYTYDATGSKLRKVSTVGAPTTTEYIDGIQYTNSTTAIDFIQTEEGKAVTDGTGYDYTYYLPDHLGNTRVVFDTKTGAAIQQQKDDYMPFGMQISRTVTSPKNLYLYNKKEFQEELQQYDYGARFYDPVIARFTTVDALAEHPEQIYLSPYGYVGNNPISRIDPDGNCFPCLILPEIAEGIAIIGEALGISTAVTANVTALTTGAIILNNLENGRSVNSSSLIARRDATVVNTPVRIKPPVVVQARKDALPGSRPGQVFTPKEKQKVKEKNKEENGGNTVCQGCGVNTTKPQKSQKGVTPPTTDTQVDHIDPKSNGGSGTAENGQVLCRGCNIDKSNKVPTPKPQGQ